MTDQQLAFQAINDAQLILEEYLRPWPQNNERILEKLVEVLERPDLVVALTRLQQQGSLAERECGSRSIARTRRSTEDSSYFEARWRERAKMR